MPGRVILVNGASSAGKSTLCRAVQNVLPAPFLHYSLDLFFFTDVLPRDDTGKLRDWPTFRPRIVDGFVRSLAAFAEVGVDVIADHIIEDRHGLDRLELALEPFDVFWVGLHAPVDELERRERLRADRDVGDARRDAATVHGFRSYDLDLDGTNGVEANAATLVRAWSARQA